MTILFDKRLLSELDLRRRERLLRETFNVRLEFDSPIYIADAAWRRCPICGELRRESIDRWRSEVEPTEAVADAAQRHDEHERRCPPRERPENIILGCE